MTQKVFALVKGCVTGVETIAVALVTYFVEPATASVIDACIVAGVGVALQICEKFVKE